MFLIFRWCKAQNFLNFLRLKNKPIQLNAFWAFKLQMLLNLLSNPSFWYKMHNFLPCFAFEASTKLELLICQAKLLSYFLRFFWVSLENFLVFFLFLLILQPNFLIKRFLIRKKTCSFLKAVWGNITKHNIELKCIFWS